MTGRRILNGLAVFYALAGLAVLGWGLYRLDLPSLTPVRALLFLGLPLVFAGVMAGSLRMSVGTRALLVVNVSAVVLAIYGYQGYVEADKAWTRAARIAQVEARTGRPFDRRSKGQMVADLRARGVEAYPSHATRFMPVPLDIDGRSVTPLSGRSGRPTVLCNETGTYTVYDADRYGFNTPDGAWPAAGGRAAIAAVGDSFTQGACVAPGEGFLDLLRRTWPATLNLGYGGTGPLIHLAALTEYASLARPRVLLWVYFENDLENLLDERLQPAYLRYLTDGAPTGLAALQPELDARIDTYMEKVMRLKGYDRFDWHRRVADFVLLRELREGLGLNLRGQLADRTNAQDLDEAVDLFGRILATARDRVAAWDGRLVVVYMPSIEHFAPVPATVESRMREPVLAAIRAAGVPLIDMKPVMAATANPAETFFLYPGSHYTAEGYALVAETVRAGLIDLGLAPPAP